MARHQIGARVSEELEEALRRTAERLDRSSSSVLRIALEELLGLRAEPAMLRRIAPHLIRSTAQK